MLKQLSVGRFDVVCEAGVQFDSLTKFYLCIKSPLLMPCALLIRLRCSASARNASWEFNGLLKWFQGFGESVSGQGFCLFTKPPTQFGRGYCDHVIVALSLCYLCTFSPVPHTVVFRDVHGSCHAFHYLCTFVSSATYCSIQGCSQTI